VWGGQLELMALSQALKVQIRVVQSGSPILKIGEEFQTCLYISYVGLRLGIIGTCMDSASITILLFLKFEGMSWTAC
jgi:hypothetical protein